MEAQQKQQETKQEEEEEKGDNTCVICLEKCTDKCTARCPGICSEDFTGRASIHGSKITNLSRLWTSFGEHVGQGEASRTPLLPLHMTAMHLPESGWHAAAREGTCSVPRVRQCADCGDQPRCRSGMYSMWVSGTERVHESSFVAGALSESIVQKIGPKKKVIQTFSRWKILPATRQQRCSERHRPEAHQLPMLWRRRHSRSRVCRCSVRNGSAHRFDLGSLKGACGTSIGALYAAPCDWQIGTFHRAYGTHHQSHGLCITRCHKAFPQLGFDTPTKLVEWIDEHFGRRHLTFRQLYEETGKVLRVTAT